jgi:hypothetical protein
MSSIAKAKYYLLAVIDVVLLNLHRIEELDENVKRASLWIGLVIGVLTLVKLGLDIYNKYQTVRSNNIDIRRKQEEERRFFEAKYKDR